MTKKIRYIGPLAGSQHYPSTQKKKYIILHHTAGSSAVEAVRWWNQTPERVGTSLLVERNGDALQCFEIAAWAWAMGINLPDPLRINFEKASVGIEIISYGFVVPEEVNGKREFFAYPLWPIKTKRVRINSQDVEELDKPWKGFKFWHKYTDSQVEAIVWLCRYLVDRFGIEVQKDLSNLCDYDMGVVKKGTPGIWSHTTVNPHKFDIYPCPRLIEALKAEFNKKPKSPNKE